MSTSGKQIVRMGPITVLSMVIVLSLATMAVLSFTTARAAQRTADKQIQAVQALYECETQGQRFVADVDAVLAQQAAGATVERAAQAVRDATGASGTGPLVEQSFTAAGRKLTVRLRIEDAGGSAGGATTHAAQALGYTVASWRMEAQIDSEEATVLWQG